MLIPDGRVSGSTAGKKSVSGESQIPHLDKCMYTFLACAAAP
jgi:hypothetical protein